MIRLFEKILDNETENNQNRGNEISQRLDDLKDENTFRNILDTQTILNRICEKKQHNKKSRNENTDKKNTFGKAHFDEAEDLYDYIKSYKNAKNNNSNVIDNENPKYVLNVSLIKEKGYPLKNSAIFDVLDYLEFQGLITPLLQPDNSEMNDDWLIFLDDYYMFENIEKLLDEIDLLISQFKSK